MEYDDVQIIGVGSYWFDQRPMRVKKKIQFGFGIPPKPLPKKVVRKAVNKRTNK